MEHILPKGDFNLTAVFLWHVAFVYLIVQMILSLIIYRNSKDGVFRSYFVYVTLLFTYVICRNYYFLDALTYLPIYLYSYFIQVVYLCIYFHFGLSLLNFKNYHPLFTKWVYKYMYVAVSIGTIIFCATLLGRMHPSYMPNYYFSYFFPVHILIALYILFRSVSLKQEKQYRYFLAGSFAFLILGVIAVVSSRLEMSSSFPIQRISFFYLGIIVECTFFGIGLGIRVRDIYRGKLESERQLNIAQQELRQQMVLQIAQQEEDKMQLQNEKELQILATQVALLENKVLRSQMNSHFVFNVLNAIKAYIVERDTENAIKYLNKFSKLMRKILDGSMNETQTLATELDTIKLYLDIESMRLHDELHVTINIHSNTDLNQVPFPALLLQPFVENAIWHGLLPSSSKKELRIMIKENSTANQLLIEIFDNGVGYVNSMAQRRDDKTNHRSYGVAIVRDRIVQFNKKNLGYALAFGIEDILTPSGTRVWLTMDKNVG